MTTGEMWSVSRDVPGCAQVLERANKSEYGLAAGIFSNNVDYINSLSRCVFPTISPLTTQLSLLWSLCLVVVSSLCSGVVS